jgi:hypothetical protein
MCRFTLGYFGVPLGIGLFAVGSTIFSQNRAVFPPFNSKRLNANLNDDDAKETMENLEKYMFRHKLPCLSRELVGNMGNYWKP